VSATFRERAGVIVIRVWIEGGAVTGLRARITAAAGLTGEEQGSGEQTVAVAAGVEEVLTAVGDWLRAFLAGG
jgi:hypothetical protein